MDLSIGRCLLPASSKPVKKYLRSSLGPLCRLMVGGGGGEGSGSVVLILAVRSVEASGRDKGGRTTDTRWGRCEKSSTGSATVDAPSFEGHAADLEGLG